MVSLKVQNDVLFDGIATRVKSSCIDSALHLAFLSDFVLSSHFFLSIVLVHFVSIVSVQCFVHFRFVRSFLVIGVPPHGFFYIICPVCVASFPPFVLWCSSVILSFVFDCVSFVYVHWFFVVFSHCSFH